MDLRIRSKIGACAACLVFPNRRLSKHRCRPDTQNLTYSSEMHAPSRRATKRKENTPHIIVYAPSNTINGLYYFIYMAESNGSVHIPIFYLFTRIWPDRSSRLVFSGKRRPKTTHGVCRACWTRIRDVSPEEIVSKHKRCLLFVMARKRELDEHTLVWAAFLLTLSPGRRVRTDTQCNLFLSRYRWWAQHQRHTHPRSCIRVFTFCKDLSRKMMHTAVNVSIVTAILLFSQTILDSRRGETSNQR